MLSRLVRACVAAACRAPPPPPLIVIVIVIVIDPPRCPYTGGRAPAVALCTLPAWLPVVMQEVSMIWSGDLHKWFQERGCKDPDTLLVVGGRWWGGWWVVGGGWTASKSKDCDTLFAQNPPRADHGAAPFSFKRALPTAAVHCGAPFGSRTLLVLPCGRPPSFEQTTLCARSTAPRSATTWASASRTQPASMGMDPLSLSLSTLPLCRQLLLRGRERARAREFGVLCPLFL